MPNELKVEVRLFNTEDAATDGSTVPRRVVEEYLASDDYKIIINHKLSLGGITHADRKVRPEYEGIIGKDDMLFVSDNITHYISKIFFKDYDPFAYALLRVFDPDKFEGKRRENIVNLRGMLESNCKPPVSVVLQALWSTSNVCEKLIRVKGCDFTANPGFLGAGVVKVMSNFESAKPGEEVKSFSEFIGNTILEGCVMATRIFSAEVINIEYENEIKNKDKVKSFSENKNVNQKERTFTREEVLLKYGINSPEALSTRGFSSFTESQFKDLINQFYKGDLDSNLTNRNPLTGNWGTGSSEIQSNNNLDSKLDRIVELAKFIVGTGNSKLVSNVFKNNNPGFIQLLNSVPESDPNYDELMKIQLDLFFRNHPISGLFINDIIHDRISIHRFPRFELFSRILKPYKTFYESKKVNLNPEDLLTLKKLLTEDIHYLITVVLNYIKSGSNLNSIFKLDEFSVGLINSSVKLSNLWRQVLLAEKHLGFVPSIKKNFLNEELKNFYDQVCLNAFNSKFDGDVQL